MKRRKLTAAAVLVAAGLALTACGSKEAETTAASAAETVAETTSEAAEESTEAVSSEAASAETTSAEAAEETETTDALTEAELKGLYEAFGESVKMAVKNKSMAELAELTAYPLYIGIDGGLTIQNEEELLALDGSKIFTDELMKAVEDADLASIEVSEAGYVIGDASGTPNVTVGLDADGAMGITGINY